MQNLTPYFDFPSPHCLFTDTFGGGSEEDLRVFTSETSNAKAKSSENFLSRPKVAKFWWFLRAGGQGGTKTFNFYSKRHIIAQIRVV